MRTRFAFSDKPLPADRRAPRGPTTSEGPHDQAGAGHSPSKETAGPASTTRALQRGEGDIMQQNDNQMVEPLWFGIDVDAVLAQMEAEDRRAGLPGAPRRKSQPVDMPLRSRRGAGRRPHGADYASALTRR